MGPKTVACIMVFGMQRHEFPVDTHVWRIAKALGWVPAKATREQAYLHLNARVPDAIKCAAPCPCEPWSCWHGCHSHGCSADACTHHWAHGKHGSSQAASAHVTC